MAVKYIKDAHAGLLYENGKLSRILEPGRYKFPEWPWSPKVEVTVVDLRERSSTIRNQEILTSDKVSLRLSILIYFRVIDAKAAIQNVESYTDRMYEDVQLAARRFLATRTLDQILRDRNELSEAIKNDVEESAKSFGVEIKRADVKDLVFPGNLREIMNRVIETERQGEAQLIAANKQAEISKVQAESSAEISKIQAESEADKAKAKLASDEAEAKLLKDNPQLIRLKELDALREIGQGGGNHLYIGVDKVFGKKD